MAPANLHGLNVIHSSQSSFDSHDLSGYPDLSAQLDLWTNLPFESEEGPVQPRLDNYRKEDDEDEDEEHRDGRGGEAAAIHDGHVNVVTGKNLETNRQTASQSSEGPAFDLQTFLAGFGIDPFANQQLGLQHPSSAAVNAPSLAQLLALHSAQSPPAPSFPGVPSHQSASYNGHSPLSADDTPYPPAKRARSRKASVSTVDSPDPDTPVSSTPLSAAEDKRRRNTAASARFRLKKKEREAALEGKAKELETRVNELERECEGLRRENGWLKGLVVGVTGAAQGSTGPAQPAVQSTTTSLKRHRDDDNA